MSTPAMAARRADLERRLGDLRPRLHRYCARMTGSVIDGEDVLQDTLLKAFAALDGGALVEDLEPWLFRIAHNAALDHLRRKARHLTALTETDMTMIEDPSASADRRIVVASSLRHFMHLPVAQRSAVILVDVLELSLEEAGAAMAATLAATKAALHRGRERLKALAADPDPVPTPALAPEEAQCLTRYIERFNAHDFDALRQLLAEDVRLELVNRTRARGKADVSGYFGNYSKMAGWRLALGFVDGRPAILVEDVTGASPRLTGFMLIEWQGEEVCAIRDFRYAPYTLADAEIVWRAPLSRD